MSLERPIGPGAEPPPPRAPAGPHYDPSGEVTAAMRLQILSTEHLSLASSRSLAWNESFSRAGMLLSMLSGAIVALALVAQASEFGEGFRLFGLVILPVVLVVGIGTLLRMGISNYHDSRCVVGMNRIRAGYLEIAPDLAPYFVMGTTDDQSGVSRTMGIEPRTSMVVQMFASTPVLVTVVNAILVGAILALLLLQIGSDTGPALALGAIGFAGTVLFFAWYARRDISRIISAHEPMFPATQASEDA